jgi:hypothetical protein
MISSSFLELFFIAPEYDGGMEENEHYGSLISADVLERRIFIIRGQKVILSMHLADLYGVAPRALVQSVRRNKKRFPSDFMFQLNVEEFEVLKSQFVTSKQGGIRRALPNCVIFF